MPDNSTLADQFLDHHAPEDWFRVETSDGYKGIDSDRVPELRDALVDFIAHVISSVIDAGSERDAVNVRDAVNENVTLHNAIEEELKGWTV